jgi:C-terminal processing protease CtpA/Prc
MIDIDKVRADAPACEQVLHLNSAGASSMPCQVCAAAEGVLDLESGMGGYEAERRLANKFQAIHSEFVTLLNALPGQTSFVENATSWAKGLSQFDTVPECLNLWRGAFGGEIAILADASTGSAAEDFLAPFKENGRATVVGRTTAGLSGQPFVKDFGNDMTLIVGSKREMFADGSQFEGIGTAPDILVGLAVDDVRRGIDRDRIQAVELLFA